MMLFPNQCLTKLSYKLWMHLYLQSSTSEMTYAKEIQAAVNIQFVPNFQ